MIAAWPEPEAFSRFIDEEAERAFELLRTVVGAARSTRARYRLSPKETLAVTARMSAEDAARFQTLSALAAELANVELVYGADVEKPTASVAVVDGGVEVCIGLEGHVDLDAEKARLEKEIAKAEKELAGVEKTLGNAGFVAKAASEVVAKKRERGSELAEQLKVLKAQLADFA